MSAIRNFREEIFSADGRSLTLFRKGTGPAVILLHELPGLTAETVEFAELIVEGGFHVAMPLLFGTPLQNPLVGLLKSPVVCIRREFNNLMAGRSSPITASLRALCRELHGEQGGPGVGAIGMCYTGGFVFAMMVEPSLVAPVTAQPSLPLFQPAALDVEPEKLTVASHRDDAVSLLGLRFEDDARCPAARFESLQAALGAEPGSVQRFRPVIIPGKGHSTLTFDYRAALDRGIDTRNLVLQHLRTRLLPI
ncbi:MAG TPA: dienelactone hydrolase family protein [Nitrosospira sp.]|nr:dienelactone hydrolase family protein [Nitrosospira sp.]